VGIRPYKSNNSNSALNNNLQYFKPPTGKNTRENKAKAFCAKPTKKSFFFVGFSKNVYFFT